MKKYRKIGFLLAAGASVDLGLPTSHGVVTGFDRLMAAPDPQITGDDRDLYRKVKASLLPKESGDFEAIFDRLSVDPEDAGIPAPRKAKKRLTGILRQRFVEMLFIDDSGIVNHFHRLGPLPSCLGYPLEVFTLNQDQGVERGAGPFAHVETGCRGYGPDHPWSPTWFPSNGLWLIICLHKVHGSTDWQRNRHGLFFSVGPGQHFDAAKAVLVLGHKEKTLARLPYTFGFQEHRFRTVGMDLVVVVGFGFRDEHVVDLLLDVLGNGTDLLVVSPETSDSFERFRARAAQVRAANSDSTPGRILLLRQRAHDFFMGLPWSLYRGVPADENGA